MDMETNQPTWRSLSATLSTLTLGSYRLIARSDRALVAQGGHVRIERACSCLDESLAYLTGFATGLVVSS